VWYTFAGAETFESAAMPEIRKGRWTARTDAPFVVFLIGMRFNKLWKVHRWAPVFAAMPRMIAELERQPELGFLGADSWFGRTILMVQYWRSFEDLEAYAKARDHAHLPAWAAFNRAVGADGDVGIFHETYQIAPGSYENIYANMPEMLFARIGKLAQAAGGYQGARSRLTKQASEPIAAPTPTTDPAQVAQAAQQAS
jgi:hypothetical protein